MNLSRDLNIQFCRAFFESVLLYSSERLTLITALKIQLDGCYTEDLRAPLNLSCISKKELNWELLRSRAVMAKNGPKSVVHKQSCVCL